MTEPRPELSTRLKRRLKAELRFVATVIQNIGPLACPICGGRGSIYSRNRLRNGRFIPVWACGACTHKFVFPIPSSEETLSWYQGADYFDQNCNHQGITSIEFGSQWQDFIDKRMRALQRYAVEPHGLTAETLKIGEVGCLEGAFLGHLSKLGHRTFGFETNSELVRRTREINGIDISHADVETMVPPGLELDVLMSFHTFEHLRNPVRALDTCIAMLRPGGVLMLEVPCDDDEMDNPDHFHFFTSGSLRRLMELRLRRVELHPESYVREGKTRLGSLFAVGVVG